ncbi:MAG: hypothetical protein ACR2L2_18345 [Acidobacteriota bacterium]
MGQTLLGLLVVAAILVASAALTQLYARAAYWRCAGCESLNAKRRSHCRVCGHVRGQGSEVRGQGTPP